MKTVYLTTDMRPWRAGDEVHVPNEVAERLVRNGEAKNMRPFNPTGAEQPSTDDRPKSSYLTKARKG